METKTIFQFQNECSKNQCNRHTMQSKNCYKASKQMRCYNTWVKALQKKSDKMRKQIQDKKDKQEAFLRGEIELEYEVDDKYEEFRKQVWIRDCGFYDGIVHRKDWKNYCRIWAILTDCQKAYFDEHYKEVDFINQDLDVCHIQERSSHPELKYEPDNAVVCARIFHTRLDLFTHPLYPRSITKEERQEWSERAKNNKEEIIYVNKKS